MANKGKIQLNLVVDDKGSVTVEKFGKKGDESFKKIGKSSKALNQKLKTTMGTMLKLGAAVGGIMAIRAAIRKATGALKEWIGLAGVQEAAEKKLGSVIKSTGMAAGFTLDQLKKMASEMQGMTTTGDEVILNGMAILATFKQIRGEGFERATKAALDMSQVMGQDLKSSIVMIGKALNDPIANLSALSRTGVQFTESQKKMIETLVESNRLTEAQGIILKELESQFGGAAKAATETFGGAQKQMTNNWFDLKEQLGFVITKNEFFNELIKKASELFKEWGEWVEKNRGYLMQLAKEGVLKVAEAIIFTIKTMRFFHNAWLGIKLVGTTSLHLVSRYVQILFMGLRTLFKPLDLLFEGLKKLGAIKVNPFDKVEEALGTFALSTKDVMSDVIKDIESTNAKYDSVIDTMGRMKKAIEKIGTTQVNTVNNKIIPALDKQQKKQEELNKQIAKQPAYIAPPYIEEEPGKGEAGEKVKPPPEPPPEPRKAKLFGPSSATFTVPKGTPVFTGRKGALKTGGTGGYKQYGPGTHIDELVINFHGIPEGREGAEEQARVIHRELERLAARGVN